MKTIIRAFSLVELLLVVTILSIVSVAGFSSFSRLASFGQWGEITGKIGNSLRSLDEQVAAKKIDSYEVILEKWAAGYIVKLGNSSGSLDMNWATGTGMIHTASTGSGTWTFSFFTDNVMKRTIAFSGTSAESEFRLPNVPVAVYGIRPFLDGDMQSPFEIRAFSSYGLMGDRGIWRISGLPLVATKVIIRNNRGVRSVSDEAGAPVISGSEIEISNNGKTATFNIP